MSYETPDNFQKFNKYRVEAIKRLLEQFPTPDSIRNEEERATAELERLEAGKESFLARPGFRKVENEGYLGKIANERARIGLCQDTLEYLSLKK